MTLQEKIQHLAAERSQPCVTISLNTYRTHPDNLVDEILLKNLLDEARDRLISQYGKRAVAPLLDRIESIPSKINRNYSLDSMHIFLSNSTEEIIKLTWPTIRDRVHIAETFDLRTVIKAYGRSEEYLVMMLSQGGVHLYTAFNEGVTGEISNGDFPFEENPHYTTDTDLQSNARLMDDFIREYFNTVDKALVKVCRSTGYKCVVVCIEDNYSKLMEVADVPEFYLGYSPIDYNNMKPHQIVGQAWNVVKRSIYEKIDEAIRELQEAVGKGLVYTDVTEIYEAAIDGRGDLLIVHEDFSQPARITGERSIELLEKEADARRSDSAEDITGDIVWAVISRGGRAYFTKQEEIRELGGIALKTRY